MNIKKGISRIFILLALLALVVGCSNPGGGNEQEGDNNQGEASTAYPERDIEVYIPASPGGSTDATARLATEYLKDILDQNIVIVNQTGGGGATAANTVYNADPDGYSLMYYHQALDASNAMNTIEQGTSDFTPLGVTGDANRVLAVLSSSDWDSLEDFVEDAKDNPGEYKIGVALGETTHIVAGMLVEDADIDIDIVDVGDDAELTTGLLGEHVDIVVVGVDSVSQTDDIKSLAVVGNDRDGRIPDVPTAEEQGYDVVFPLTFTFLAPNGTSDEIIDVWEDALEELEGNSEYAEEYEVFGTARFLTSEETKEELQRSAEVINDVVEALGLN